MICSVYLSPDYKFLGIMKRQFPGVPLLGLTATAPLKVLQDVKTILHIPNCLLLRSSFNRPNLYYQVKVAISMCCYATFWMACF